MTQVGRQHLEALEDRETLAQIAALEVGVAIRTALERRGRATAVFTGGSTPGPLYDRLAAIPLDWGKVTLTLSDERWVPAGDPDANETLIRARLLQGHAANAGFIPLKSPAADPQGGARVAAHAVRDLFPTDLTLLGMGEDGHIASLFPDDPVAAAAGDPDAPLVVCVPMSPTEPRLPRLSLTLRALLDTAQIVLLVTGGAKRALIERVADEADYAPPVAAILRQTKVPVRILWAP